MNIITAALILTGRYECGDAVGNYAALLFLLSCALLPFGLLARKSKELKPFILPFILSLLLLFPMSIVYWSMPYEDLFGKKHPIPEGFAYHDVLGYNTDTTTWKKNYRDAHIDITDESTYLQVWGDGVGGMYCYDFYYKDLPRGKIWLKAYEATENIPLSNRWGIRTAHLDCDVATPGTHSFKKLVEKQGFSIYDGDWFDYYAVRLEVWFTDAKTRKSRKLMEKTYRMEGWMR